MHLVLYAIHVIVYWNVLLFRDKHFDIKWVDKTHAIGIFSNQEIGTVSYFKNKNLCIVSYRVMLLQITSVWFRSSPVCITTDTTVTWICSGRKLNFLLTLYVLAVAENHLFALFSTDLVSGFCSIWHSRSYKCRCCLNTFSLHSLVSFRLWQNSACC